MEVVRVTDELRVSVVRTEDGYIATKFSAESLDGVLVFDTERLYRPEMGLHDACGDICRILCGWAEFGQLGMSEVLVRLEEERRR